MSKAQLDTCIEVVAELATLHAVVGAFQFDSIVGCVHNVQTKQYPMVARQVNTAVAHILRTAVAIKELLLKVEDRCLGFVRRNHDRLLCRPRLLQANSQFGVCSAPRHLVSAASTEYHIACLGYTHCLAEIIPRFFKRAIARLVVACGRYIIGVAGGYEGRAGKVGLRVCGDNRTTATAGIAACLGLYHLEIVHITIALQTGKTNADLFSTINHIMFNILHFLFCWFCASYIKTFVDNSGISRNNFASYFFCKFNCITCFTRGCWCCYCYNFWFSLRVHKYIFCSNTRILTLTFVQ